ncbi:hypothetical protein IFE08_07930 [Treponema pedis]|uniref:Uncharacterized protein n=2 Tax=Treponema pedis TaxID=409322 RepID=S6A137_9SPIR|nr:hypothetical protein TPE_2009 [Treponema pedis str. T A4]QOW62255.1 hypothetical protein IFE08_07930 [Treponema pedis]
MLVGQPSKIDDFNLIQVDEISVYVKKGVIANDDTLTISAKRFLWKESLVVQGMAY